MSVDTKILRETIISILTHIETCRLSPDAIATAYVLAFPPSVALLVLDELIALEANARLIAEAEVRNHE